MSFEFNSIKEVAADLAAGKPVVMLDNEDRENEGDFICAAEFATTENVNFVAKWARGLICMPMDASYADKLNLPQMCITNTDNHCTAFSVSVDHVDTTTGISAEERGYTARKFVDENAKPDDFRRPGHMFPLQAVAGGVIERNGHTEATVDLMKVAGLKPCGLCCEIMKDDGTMARKDDLLAFAEEHNLKISTIEKLVQYRKEHEVFVECVAKAKMPTRYGIRLDSGDLAYLSKKARKMLDAAGYPDAVIAASSDLDEYLINSLKNQGAAITSWGVGTNLITSADNPSFGGVYKLAAIKKPEDEEFTAKIKISENPAKITNPGNKTVFRLYNKETGKIKADLIALSDETYNEAEDLEIFDQMATWKRSTLPGGSYEIREMLVPVFLKGQCVYQNPSTMEIREYCRKELNTLWDETRRLVNPQEVFVDLSKPLYDLKQKLLNSRH